MSRFCPSRAGHPAYAAAILAVALVACGGPSVPALTDPAAILQAGAASLGELRSFHLRGAVEGEIALDLGGAGGAPLRLDGTTLEGDVDVVSGELAVELLAPSLLNLRANLVVAGGAAYLRAPIVTGDSWVLQPAGGGLGGNPADAVDGLAAFLARPELTPEKLPDARCGGTDCYTVRFTVPADEVAGALGSLAGTIPGLTGAEAGDVAVTARVRKQDRRLASLDLEVQDGAADPLVISLALSRFDEPVTIDAPPADEVTDAPGGISGG